MSVFIADHTLTNAEHRVLRKVIDHLQKNSGDSHWTSTTSPKGDGQPISVRDIFPERNNKANADRRTVDRLAKLGILAACEIELDSGMLKGVPEAYAKVSPALDAGKGSK